MSSRMHIQLEKRFRNVKSQNECLTDFLSNRHELKEENEQQTKKPGHKVLRLIAQWAIVGVVLFVFITGMYISLAAYTGHSIQFTNFDSFQTPLILTGIVLSLFIIASIFFSSFASKDGAWVLMTGPYVR